MPTFLENLITRRNAIGVELASIANTDDPAYKDGLYRELDNINKQIEAAGKINATTGKVESWEIETEARP